LNNFHEYPIQHFLKSGCNKYNFRQVKVPGIAPYWNACVNVCILYIYSTYAKYFYFQIPGHIFFCCTENRDGDEGYSGFWLPYISVCRIYIQYTYIYTGVSIRGNTRYFYLPKIVFVKKYLSSTEIFLLLRVPIQLFGWNTRGGGGDPINRLNYATFLCHSNQNLDF
jgi:hypothetical protein